MLLQPRHMESINIMVFIIKFGGDILPMKQQRQSVHERDGQHEEHCSPIVASQY